MYSSMVTLVTRIGGGDARRRSPVRRPISGRTCATLSASASFREEPIIKSRADAATERGRPVPKALLLARDEGVQRIKDDGLHALADPARLDLARQVVDDRHEEALGLAGARAACDEHGARRPRRGERAPSFKLVGVGLPVPPEPVALAVGQHLPVTVERRHCGGVEQVSGEARHRDPGRSVARRRLHHRLAQEGAVLHLRRAEAPQQFGGEARVIEARLADHRLGGAGADRVEGGEGRKVVHRRATSVCPRSAAP